MANGRADVIPGSVKVTMPKDRGDGRKPAPSLFMGNTAIVCHLSEGFKKERVPDTSWGAQMDGSIDSAVSREAWVAKAEFDLDTDDATLINQWDYGFIQIMYAGQFYMQYAGAKSGLGSIAIEPDFQDTHYLDSNPETTPWTRPAADRQDVAGRRVTCYTGDHPAFLTKRKQENFHDGFTGSTAIENHFQVINYSMYFLTVLTRRLKIGVNKPEPLASFRWNLRYRFEVKYLQGKPNIINNSELKFDPQAKIGEPNFNGDERKIYENTTGLFFNTSVPTRYRAALAKGSPNRKDSKTWFLNIPKDFFVE